MDNGRKAGASFVDPSMEGDMGRLIVFAASLLVALAAGIGHAAAAMGCGNALPFNKAFVHPTSGVDVGGCGPVGSPCKTLNQALQGVCPGGTVVIVAPGAFGPIYLTQPVTIVGLADRSVSINWSSTAPGCVAFFSPGNCGLAIANYAVEIAGSPGDIYRFENIVIDAAGSPNGAVKVGNAFNVSMTGVVIRGGTGAIPQMMLVAPSTGTQFQLFMSHCDVGFSTTGGGVLVQPASATTAADLQIAESEFHNAKFGVKLSVTATSGAVQGSIDSSKFYAMNGSGIAAANAGQINNGQFVAVALSRNNVVNSGAQGVQINGNGATFFLYHNTIANNAVGVNIQNSGVGFTTGTNLIHQNGNNCVLDGTAAVCSTVLGSMPQD